ncbi:MAG: NADP-dependent oxidoreductase [Rhodocyclales bacterium]|nr:NADP-dependent oxidoreductase [Rhodocyclales bacterium]
MDEVNKRIVLAARPTDWPEERHFRLEAATIPEPGPGQFLVRNHWLSLDPYMRGRMREARSYARPVELGEVMIGGTVGEVIASHHPGFRVGEFVVGVLGWQLYALSEGTGMRKIADEGLPLSVYLGAVGMPGVTAWIGLKDIAVPRPGDTVVVSAAAGAVGSVAGQLAKLAGCRAVGIAGGPAKCAHVVERLGFDACIDYKSGDVGRRLATATPEGIDVLFENVGGPVMDACLARLNPFARVALCGLVAQYNLAAPLPVTAFASLLTNRVKLQGFIVTDYPERWPAALAELAGLVQAGRLRYQETVAQGLESAPGAFIGLLRGENLGKQLVRLV